jgi:hypothetical protein
MVACVAGAVGGRFVVAKAHGPHAAETVFSLIGRS